ncbi:MAG: hypothetical protein JXJ04_15140 [Spirochaetales bacterium]|nr:hypothetical protein [Spirochaetales bacterium]
MVAACCDGVYAWFLFILVAAGAFLWIQFPGFNIKFAKDKIEKNKLLSFGIINNYGFHAIVGLIYRKSVMDRNKSDNLPDINSHEKTGEY